MTMRLAIRVFFDGVKQREDRISLDMELLEDLLPKLAREHAEMMASRRSVVEIEFLDELNPEVRFFRMGTDPSGMVMPVAVDLTKPEDALSRWGKVRPN